MRKTYGKYGGLGVVVLALLLGLLMSAGPAMATDPFDGYPPAFGKHEVNMQLYWWGVDDPVNTTESYFWAKSTDPRFTGDVVVTLADLWVEDGYLHVSGSVRLENDDGYWTCPYFEHVLSPSVFVRDSNQGVSTVDEVFTGHGDHYGGLVAHFRGHAPGGLGHTSYWLYKGWIED